MAAPTLHRQPISPALKTRKEKTHIERIIPPHLSPQLAPNPPPHPRVALRIEPPDALHLPHDPPPLALPRQHPAQACVVRYAPEGEVCEEEGAGEGRGEEGEEEELEGEEGEGEDVEVGFWVGGVEEGEDVVRCGDSEDCAR